MIFLKEVPPDELVGFGVPRFEGNRITDIVEKPGDPRLNPGLEPPSPYAVIGLYCYDAAVFEIIRGLDRSARGEFEISDVNRTYAKRGELSHAVLDGWWGDAGTPESLDEIGTWIKADGANRLLHQHEGVS
jgi:glucose-1-phosphate thymidylyltransferase